MEPKILYEDSDLLVLDKPSGMTTNRSDTTKDQKTVQDWTASYLHLFLNGQDFSKTEEEKNFYERGGIVHRLDKETSGILLVAKNSFAFADLQKQFKERMVTKTYLSLAHGKMPQKEGEIAVPVGRLPWNRKQFGVIAGGRDAFTFYRVFKSFVFKPTKEIVELVELFPKTGRTHQIRVHLKYVNRPIFGDFLYAGRKTARNDRLYLQRVFLHASQIKFLHPQTKETLEIKSPLPSELAEFLQEYCGETIL